MVAVQRKQEAWSGQVSGGCLMSALRGALPQDMGEGAVLPRLQNAVPSASFPFIMIVNAALFPLLFNSQSLNRTGACPVRDPSLALVWVLPPT